VRPKPPQIEEPSEDDELEKIVIIYGTTEGINITKVEVKIGNYVYKQADVEESNENEYVWSYEWDTTDVDNGDYAIKVRSGTTSETSREAIVNVTVQNAEPLSLTITSHQSNDKVKGMVTISGTSTGEVDTIQVKIGDESWSDATPGTPGDWSTWEFRWDTTEIDNGRYEILVRLTATGEQPITNQITLNVNNPTADDEPAEEEGPSFMDWIMENKLIIAALLLVIIFLLIIILLVTRKRRRQRELIEKEEEIERLEAERAERKRLELEMLEKERELRIIKQPVRCPKCKEYSVIEDDGERPLMIECVHCGARGFISVKAKTLEEPKLPKKYEEEEKLIIQCPKCDEMFTAEDELGEIVCPNCGVRGQLNEETIDELKQRREELAEKMKEQQEQREEKEKPEKPSEKKLGMPEKKIKCPNCSNKFAIPGDAKTIECPSCGATGTL
jgi:DNA-directed RNA polymerase subunit RPC12/RpoP